MRLLPNSKVLTWWMIQRLSLLVVLAGIIAGCSKKEEAPSTPPATSGKTETKSPAIESLTTNAQNAVTAVASKASSSVTYAAQSALGITNALVQRPTEVAKSSTQTPAPVPLPSDAATPAPTPPSVASLSSDQVTQALKEALAKGLQHAVSTLGQPGGFLTNLNVKIPIPDKLQLIEKGLRAINQGQYADQCVTSMNQAAEQAVPAAADVFVNSLKNIPVEDAKGLLSGPQNAATQYFRKATEAELTTKFSPIVQQRNVCGESHHFGFKSRHRFEQQRLAFKNRSHAAAPVYRIRNQITHRASISHCSKHQFCGRGIRNDVSLYAAGNRSDVASCFPQNRMFRQCQRTYLI